MKKFTPYSENIIFLDTEFSTMDPYEGEILSIGLVKLNGDEFYLELEHEGEVSSWVKKNIIDTLTEPKVSRKAAVKRIKNFVGKNKPYAIAYANDYDMIYTYKLFDGKKTEVFHWLPIDFTSILFALGVDPESYYHKDKKSFFKKIEIDASKYREHHALDDAKLLREVYLKLVDR